MKRRLVGLAALLALAGMSTAEAQRAPLFGVWFGAIHCGPTGGRWTKLYLYGDGTGMLDLGVPSYAPDTKPAVALVSLRQPPEADYVLIDQWVINGVEPRLQLAGQIGADGTYSGQVLNDARCQSFSLKYDPRRRGALFTMRRNPARAAQVEATMLDPHLTPRDVAEMGLFGWAMMGGVRNGLDAGGGGVPRYSFTENPSSGGRATQRETPAIDPFFATTRGVASYGQ